MKKKEKNYTWLFVIWLLILTFIVIAKPRIEVKEVERIETFRVPSWTGVLSSYSNSEMWGYALSGKNLLELEYVCTRGVRIFDERATREPNDFWEQRRIKHIDFMGEGKCAVKFKEQTGVLKFF